MQRAGLRVFASRNLNSCYSFSTSFSVHNKNCNEELLESIKERIAKNRNILKKHSSSHLKAREVNASISNLRMSMASVQKKQKAAHEPPANSVVNIPSQVSIEILGNGTGLLRACFILRTPLKTYMFNCPENACRFLWQLRIRSSSVVDLFITSPNWDNIAGISSILLSKESNAMPTRLHGAVNIKHFLECIRPFQDSDYGSSKYPSQVEERPFTMENYEDAGLKVTYIPLSPPLDVVKQDRNRKVNNIDIAFLVEMKEAARRIDINKLMELKVPKGSLIGKLKSGEAVKLPDGRTIQPDEVLSSHKLEGDKPLLLVVECTTEDHVKALLNSSSIQQFLNGGKQLDYMVHLSDDTIINTTTYKTLMGKLNNSNTTHLLINNGNPVIPAVESVYKHTRLLRSIAPSLFPELHPIEWKGIITQNEDLAKEQDCFIRVAPIQRYWMRKANSVNEEPIVNNLLSTEPDLSEKARELINEYRKLENETIHDCEFPKLTFFGTSSAVPSKYRNVTGYLVEGSEESALLVDVGEGTYGQMRAILGDEGCMKLLVNLHCVLITHAHQDHMNGLYTIIARRKEAFEFLGKPYRSLVLVCNRNVLKPLKTYSICFENIESLLEIVDISRHPLTPPGTPNEPPGKRPRLPSPHLPPSRNVLDDMPSTFDRDRWKLDELKAVQVHHTRMANGFVMRVAGKKIVFSGDTKPCDLLVEQGQNADILVHESTFEDGHEADALRKRHSTMSQAVDVGKRMNAKNIILTHFSARYPKVPVLPQYLDEKNIGVAMDMLRVRFDHLSLIPKLLPIFREIFVAELFELTIKKEQRVLKDKETSDRRNLKKAAKSM